MGMGIVAAVTFMLIVAGAAWNHLRFFNGDWHFHRSPRGDLMRRRIGRKWEYREMTEAERDEFLNITAW